MDVNLKIPYGQDLIELRCKSTLSRKSIKEINYNTSCEISSAYLLFSNNSWYKITSLDGVSTFQKHVEPKIIGLVEWGDFFAEEVKKLEINDLPTLSSLKGVIEVFWKGEIDESVGFELIFSNQSKLCFINNGDCIEVNSGSTLTDDVRYSHIERLLLDE